MNQMSDKEIQVVDLDDLDKSEISKSWTSPDHEFLQTNVTACWMMRNSVPWDKVTLRDEAVQTHSQGQKEMHDANRGFPSTRKKQRKKKTFDEVHLCQECNQYINQAGILVVFDNPFPIIKEMSGFLLFRSFFAKKCFAIFSSCLLLLLLIAFILTSNENYFNMHRNVRYCFCTKTCT